MHSNIQTGRHQNCLHRHPEFLSETEVMKLLQIRCVCGFGAQWQTAWHTCMPWLRCMHHE